MSIMTEREGGSGVSSDEGMVLHAGSGVSIGDPQSPVVAEGGSVMKKI
jgi:hypothetical protein